MNLDKAKEKLEQGILTLDTAGNNQDLLGLALTKIHGALEDACRLWLSEPSIAQQHRLNIQERSEVSWKDLPDLMATYYQWSENDVKYVRRINSMRNQVAHGEGFQGSRQDVEDYKNYVKNLLSLDRQTAHHTTQYIQDEVLNTSHDYNNYLDPITLPKQKNIVVAYGLWCLCFFGLFGVHRFYLGKPLTGLLWFFSGGLFFIGQIIDLFLIPTMITEDDNRYLEKLTSISKEVPALDFSKKILHKLDQLDGSMQRTIFKSEPIIATTTNMPKLLQVAHNHGKVLSVGQAVMATGLTTDEVQKLLDQAVRNDIAHIGNDPETGAIRYYFDI